MTYSILARRSASALAVGLYFAAMPVTVDFNLPGDGGVGLTAANALAKDGRDDDGSGSSGRSGSGGRSGGSGRSGGGDDSGRSGDDDSGRGGSGGSGGHGSDDRNDDRGGNGSRGSDDDRSAGSSDRDDDDRRGRGRGSDDGPARGVSTTAWRGSEAGDLRVVKVEEGRSGIEVVYSNGVKEEIEDGRYELKNAAGRTVFERSATSSDLARIEGNVRNSGMSAPGGAGAALPSPRPPSGSPVRRVEVGSRSIEVSYGSGWREEVEFGRYELKDPNDNTVVERRATQADVDRLMALAR